MLSLRISSSYGNSTTSLLKWREGTIQDDTFKRNSEELLSQIKEAENDVADTNNRSASSA